MTSTDIRPAIHEAAAPATPVVPGVAGLRVVVVGLARSGLATIRALRAGGAEVVAWDDAEAARLAGAAAGAAIAAPDAIDWSGVALLVVAPGLPLHFPRPHAAVRRARAAGVAITGDVDLLFGACGAARYAAITGTNGKSTTTALLGHVISRLAGTPVAGAPAQVAVGGNLGVAPLDLPALGGGALYVLELSSYQLDLTQAFAPAVGVLLNLSPDHIDRHGDFAGYVAAKRRLFDHQPAGAIAIVGCDDGPSIEVFDALAAEGRLRVIPIAATRPVAGGVWLDDAGRLIDDLNGQARPVMSLDGIDTLRGRHNGQNAAAAYAAARALGLAPDDIVAGIRSYPGLPHRLETVGRLGGCVIVNDSKATNAEAVRPALETFDRIYWIAGGVPKAGGIAMLKPWFDRIAHAWLIGEAAEGFAATLDGAVPWTIAGTLDVALDQALAAADAAGDTAEGAQGVAVLLSPACASFDQYKSFEHRGDAFRALVAARLEGRS